MGLRFSQPRRYWTSAPWPSELNTVLCGHAKGHVSGHVKVESHLNILEPSISESATRDLVIAVQLLPEAFDEVSSNTRDSLYTPASL